MHTLKVFILLYTLLCHYFPHLIANYDKTFADSDIMQQALTSNQKSNT